MKSQKPTPVFEKPWHAQVFALTVHLNETGHFEWTQWAERFGATLKSHGMTQDLNGGSDYFEAWLETLEGFLCDLELAEAEAIKQLRAAWAEAFMATPHGQPVRLSE